MNKFRIVEQRGVFRIQSCRSYEAECGSRIKVEGGKHWWNFEKTSFEYVYETAYEWYFCAKCADVEFVPNDSRYDGAYREPHYNEVKEYEFDTYKKAENYIKKFYGSTGVDAIEKPEWQVK